MRFGIVAVLILGLSPLAQAGESRVTFLHFNDIYEFMPSADSGGLAALKTVIDHERATHAGAILTFGGDLLSPSVASHLSKGAHMIDLLNRLSPAAAVLGNHEFDFGTEILRTRMSESRFPWVVANVTEADGRPFGPSVPTLMVDGNGVKIGIFGVLTPETATLSVGVQALFSAETIAAKAAVADLRAQGADLVVALTHLDLQQDQALALQVKGIDLILGGHDHQAMSMEVGSTLLVKAGHDGAYLAAVDMTVEHGDGNPTKVTASGWRFISTRGVAAAADMAEITQRYDREVNSALEESLAQIAAPLDSRQEVVRNAESTLGNFVADSLRDALHADIALINGGGLRGNRVYAAGTMLTRLDILRELPFGNKAVLLELSGADILAALEHGVSKAPALAGRFPQVSGLSFRYDPQAESGQRLRAAAIAGTAIDPARRYRVATNDYLAGGGDGYAVLGRGTVLIDGNAAPLLSTVVMDQALRQGVVHAVLNDRIQTTHAAGPSRP
ncbi:bifunctional metallophosphatase/5'-nucleotidase [Magnetospirillum sulfuroxidans]|uniref:5'-nucleotidase C-terminal domain-containing protein n=1 Tax=Magnetospirillum sulfuroxidans TaxID=611300 RepID=A0ABS5IDP3_9PROT|nr:5'-nucleotidase C-terminal domain-containing protein [Magnetospirillum sulfuroxidans]MBR9972536.1 5'-nucleotidase C-terminal domain-containing protein [Magnetospirillum sulfuroxidans]